MATRRSPLALWQAGEVQRKLQAGGRSARLSLITTTGDRILDRALDKVGGKGLFLKEIEQALLQGDADLAVHSLKDVPMVLPAGFRLAAVLPREDPRDALVAPGGQVLADLPPGARVGTSSLRRGMMLRRMRPDLEISFIRGNVEGRIAKLVSGEFAAIVLALAGLRRLGLEHHATEVFEPSRMLPAVGQGAIAIETCCGRSDLQEILAPMNDRATELCVSAERAVGRHMDAGCSQPFAAFARLSSGVMHLEAAHQGGGDSEPIFAMASAPVHQVEQALSLGEEVAGRLRKA
ncbi:hydroxymethylbilane synthase [Variovorax sp. PBL-H6]|uniref:hydroxymethylbilane synthase n=1 Tax=Variovorax sp. PBL-H6 TaxID=434009 RepID=UPI002F96D7A0